MHEELTGDWNKFSSRISEAEDALAFALQLRGDRGVGLKRYVLGVMFDQVVYAANEMLAKVHGGRYCLVRTEEATGGSRKRGLDLSSFIRQIALDQNLPAVDPKEFFSLISEINNIRKIIPNVSDTTMDHKLEDLSSHLFRAMTNRKDSDYGNNQNLAYQSVTLERR